METTNAPQKKKMKKPKKTRLFTIQFNVADLSHSKLAKFIAGKKMKMSKKAIIHENLQG